MQIFIGRTSNILTIVFIIQLHPSATNLSCPPPSQRRPLCSLLCTPIHLLQDFFPLPSNCISVRTPRDICGQTYATQIRTGRYNTHIHSASLIASRRHTCPREPAREFGLFRLLFFLSTSQGVRVCGRKPLDSFALFFFNGEPN